MVEKNSQPETRRKFLAGAAGAAGASLAGCLGGDDDDGGDDGGDMDDGGEVTGESDDGMPDFVNVATWGGAYGQGSEEHFLDPWGEENGVDVNRSDFGNDFDLIGRQQAGGDALDLIMPGYVALYSGIQDDLVDTFDLDDIEGADRIVDTFHPDNVPYDPGEEAHHIPFVFGGDGLTYNTEEMDRPDSWWDIYTDENDGRIAQPGFIDRTVGVAAAHAEIEVGDIGENTDEKMEEVWDVVEDIEPFVFNWFDEAQTMSNLLGDGSAVAGQLWIGRAFPLREEDGVPVEYTVPEEGASGWTDVWAIPVESEKKEASKSILEYTLRDEPSAAFAQDIPYGPGQELDDPPAVLEENEDIIHNDRLSPWDVEVLNENQEEWQREFQELIR